MKHASAHALEPLVNLLAHLRALPGWVERKPGIFYVKSKAALHFHENPAGLFADVRLGSDNFDRFEVNTAQQQALLLKRVLNHYTPL